MHPRRGRALAGAALLLIASTWSAGAGLAQEVPLRRLDVRDGLAHSRVTSIHQDRWGYLWFGTWEGLSRFDGYRFVNYGFEAGLERPALFAVAEDSAGRMWAADWGAGVARLDDPGPAGLPRFRAFRPDTARRAGEVFNLFFDRPGSLWCLTLAGVFRGDPAGDSLRFAPIPLPALPEAGLCRRDGSVWLAAGGALYRMAGNRPEPVLWPGRPRPASVIALAEASDGALYLADSTGVWVSRDGGGREPAAGWSPLPVKLLHPGEIRCLLAGRAGDLWVGTRRGLVRYAGGRTRVYTVREGLPDSYVRTLLEDDEGNLWIGTNAVGVCEYSGERIVSLAGEETGGLERTLTAEGVDGRIYATGSLGVVEVSGDGAIPVPGSSDPRFANLNYRLDRDAAGDWWAGTDRGLYRIPGPDLDFTRARAVPGPAAGRLVLGLWVDRVAGRLWVGMGDGGLFCGRVDGGGAPRLEPVALPSIPGFAPRQIFEDRGGTVWVAGFQGIVRLREGRAETLAPGPGLPETEARCLFQDSRGRLWLGLRNRGVSMTRDPDADRPEFENYSTPQGLASETVWWVAEDRAGRIYLATGRGLDRLDPLHGGVVHFTTADGLAGEVVNHGLADRQGRIWIATSGGLSRLDPAGDPPPPPAPRVYLSRVRVDDREAMLSGRGTTALGGLVLSPAHDHLAVEFVGLRYRPGTPLRYRYRLEGADSGFHDTGGERSVNFAHLAPGRYRFRVQALDLRSPSGPAEASVSFTVLPPLYQRAWFLTLAALRVLLAALAWHRARVRRILALEGIRRRIALDLHDEVGSGLAEIAILSEVARGDATQASDALLDHTAGRARALRQSMNDIVWSVDPRRDRLLDLVRRMRQTAFNLLRAAGVETDFDVPLDRELRGIGLGPDRRRHLLLFFQETVTNVARHAGARRMAVCLRVEGNRLDLTVRDDGRGFDPAAARLSGNGLGNLEARAAALGGRCTVESAPGEGAAVRLEAPLGRGRWPGFRRRIPGIRRSRPRPPA